MRYGDTVKFEGNRLFSGAIDLDWLFTDANKAMRVASSYVFHGSQYHAGNSLDGSVTTGHKLTDSISMVEAILDSLAGNNDNMLLAIAGYGAGKSHFALSLATLLSSTDHATRDSIISRINTVDQAAGARIAGFLDDDTRPYLVLPINGMRNAGLSQLFFDTINKVLEQCGQSKSCLNDFNPRFEALKERVLSINDQAVRDIVLSQSGLNGIDDFVQRMNSFDDDTYSAVLRELGKNNIRFFVPAATGELKDMIISVANTLCGDGKPFRGMLILFDEFGKYMSFAAGNESVAGSGIMQQLFEGIQGSNEGSHVVLLGLSQLDLSAYQRGIGNLAFSNNMNRYVTRFNAAKRYFLSVCFESLVANLIVKESVDIINGPVENSRSLKHMKKTINTYFRSSADNPIWKDEAVFLNTVFKGCWPLSPLTVWTLTYITSVNNILQQRSGFNILAKLFSDYEGQDIPEEYFPIKPVELYDRGLGDEFYNSEQSFKSADPIAQEYHFLLEKYQQQLNEKDITVLKAIVLSNKLGSACSSEQEARELIELLSGLNQKVINSSIEKLTDVFTALSFNNASKRYEIHSNAVSISEFEKYITDKIKDYKISHSAAEQFDSVIEIVEKSPYTINVRDAFLKNVESDFSATHSITSIEWGYERRIVTGYNYLEKIETVIKELLSSNPVQFYALKGRIIYAIIPSSISLDSAKSEIKKLYESYHEKTGSIIPVMCLLLHDEDNVLLDASIEISVMDGLSEDDISKFSTLIPKRREERIGAISDKIQEMMAHRNYIYPIESVKPLRRTGTDIFEEIYPKAIPFEIDGFLSESGNGGATVASFTRILAGNSISWNDFLNLGSRETNRATSLLDKCWGCFDKKSGAFLQYPRQDIISEYFHQLDSRLESDKALNVYDVFQDLMKSPYGCNSSQSTLLVFVYLAGRMGQFEFRQDDSIIPMSSYVQDKNAFETKTRAFTKAKWINIRAVVSVSDPAKWYTLLSRWMSENTYKGLQLCKEEADELQYNMISVPPAALGNYQKCVNKSEKAIAEYARWRTQSVNLENFINSSCDGEQVRRPLIALNDYMELYKSTLGRGEFKCDEEEKAAYESTRDYALAYITNHYLLWVDQHPADGIIFKKSDYDELKKKYDSFARTLDAVGLDDEAIEVRGIIDNCGNRRNAYGKYITEYSAIQANITKLADFIEQGLYAYSQVESYRKDIAGLIEQINNFPADLLEKIPGYTFDKLKTEAEALNDLVSNKIKEIDSDFEKLLNYEISSLSDLNVLEDMASPVIAFYSGAGKSKSENLADAQLVRKEVGLLKNAYKELSDSSLSEAELSEKLDVCKDKIYSELDGDNIYPDDDILEQFYSDTLDSMKNKSAEWIRKQEQAFSACASLNDYIRLSQALLALPPYLTEEDGKIVSNLQLKLDESISNKRVEYIFELYSQLSDADKDKFKNLL